MSQITIGELWARREAVETAGATLLGRFLFEFARVDVNLGLCLVWLDAGAKIETLTNQVTDLAFSKRLECLEEAVNRRLAAGHAGRKAYGEWIARAHAMRKIRNELVHGRWGVDPIQEMVVNVVGLPTSPAQRSVGYRLSELENMLRELRDLEKTLASLRERWPL